MGPGQDAMVNQTVSFLRRRTALNRDIPERRFDSSLKKQAICNGIVRDTHRLRSSIGTVTQRY
jgi:hypothetical protein